MRHLWLTRRATGSNRLNLTLPKSNMFEHAIEKLESSGQLVSQPQSFKEYFEKNGLAVKGVAQHISINRFSDLKQELKDANCTVFRLGAHQHGNNTWFSIAKTVNGWNDYFLFDQDIWGSLRAEDFVSSIPQSNFMAYRLIPKLTETSLVNLAFASGLLHHALGLEKPDRQSIPATGKSTFSFKMKAHSSSETILDHIAGQVEIDAIFTARQNGRDCLFILEAKSGTKFDTLSKQKLVYPVLSLQKVVPREMEIIPIYLRTVARKKGKEFNIAECRFPLTENTTPAVNELEVIKANRFFLGEF